MLTATALVFALTTSNVVTWVCLTYIATSNVTSAYHTLILASNALENATTLLVDAILIYRCWLVYNKSWPVILFPLLLWLSNIGLFISCSYKSAIGMDDRPFAIGLYSCNNAINLYATSAIIYQIWLMTKQNDSSFDLLYVCRDLVLCGLPYLFTNLFSLTIMVKQPTSIVYPMSCAMNSSICGIVFTLILIRAGLHRTDTQAHEHRDGGDTSSLHFAVPHTTGEDHLFGHSAHSGHRTGGIVLEKLP